MSSSKQIKPTNIFKAVTNSAYHFKFMIDLLRNNLKTASFRLSKKGITLRMMDTYETICFDINLEADKFISYKFKSEPITIGLNLSQLTTILKPIKKNDSISLFIKSNSKHSLGVSIIPKDNNQKITSNIHILDVQDIDIDLPDGYTDFITLKSNFTKMCKGMSKINNILNVEATASTVRFMSGDGILDRTDEYGSKDSDDDDSDDDEIIFDQEFFIDQFLKITKISGLGNTIKLYACNNNKPLLLKTILGCGLGSVSVYIKSKKMIENKY